MEKCQLEEEKAREVLNLEITLIEQIRKLIYVYCLVGALIIY